MKLWKLLLAGSALALVAAAFRDFENDRWLLPAGFGPGAAGPAEDEAEEPILGYDGMDEDTLLAWLDDAGLDRQMLLSIYDYEERHLGRQEILAALDDKL
ncbi:MAG TPA: hypothetical protein VFI96_09385 [Longimicrobiaceae bacterium]|nr:hypothetical protein [Longimicrobiaceae bacterium]